MVKMLIINVNDNSVSNLTGHMYIFIGMWKKIDNLIISSPPAGTVTSACMPISLLERKREMVTVDQCVYYMFCSQTTGCND